MDIQQISGKDILDLGIPEGKLIGDYIDLANNKLSHNQSWEVIKQEILQDYFEKVKNEEDKYTLRNNPLDVSVAARANSSEEQENLDKSLVKMQEVTLCPKVKQAALMPDCCPSGHSFGTIPVGGCIAVDNAIIPAAHSADLFCSMFVTLFSMPSNPQWASLLDILQQSTHFGYKLPKDNKRDIPETIISDWNNPFLIDLQGCATNALGTQGDGNHFACLGEVELTNELLEGIELTEGLSQRERLERSGKIGDKLLALVTHHGSRGFGAEVYKRGIKAAIEYTNSVSKNNNSIPSNLAWLDLDTDLGKEYERALCGVANWTKHNHKIIHGNFAMNSGLYALTSFGNEHNAVWRNLFDRTEILHGKGATPAWNNTHGIPQVGVIPLNMSAPILLTYGLNNSQFLGFSPHGAGRNRSRTETNNMFNSHREREDALKESTKDILVSWYSGKPDVTESPIGYKNATEIKQQIEDFKLAHVFGEIMPKATLMAGDMNNHRRSRKKNKGVNNTKEKKHIYDN